MSNTGLVAYHVAYTWRQLGAVYVPRQADADDEQELAEAEARRVYPGYPSNGLVVTSDDYEPPVQSGEPPTSEAERYCAAAVQKRESRRSSSRPSQIG